MEITETDIKFWDAEDSLASFRTEFWEDADQVLYLDGNSLGKLPKQTRELMPQLVEQQWGNRLIRGWNEGWVTLPHQIASLLAQLLNAEPEEVTVGDTTTLQLYKLCAGILRQSERTMILTEAVNFPTDLYILQGLVKHPFQQHVIEYIPDAEDPTQAAYEAMHAGVSLMVLSMVQYKSGYWYDVARLSKRAKALGIALVWDLSHAIGAVPIDVKASGMEYAVGCTYKYLNGGPGAPAFAWVEKSSLSQLENPIWGWFSHARPFDFAAEYLPAVGGDRLATGTPSILSLAPVKVGVEIILRAGKEAVRQKSVHQLAVLEQLFVQELAEFGFEQVTPTAPAQRGSHLTFRHPEGWRISKALVAGLGGRVVIPDFRPPYFLRLGIAPLYVSYQDLWDSVQCLRRVMQEESYLTLPILAGEVP